MKKIFLILSVIILSFYSIKEVNAKNTKLLKGSSYSDKITWRFLDISLPEGDWEFYYKLDYTISTIRIHCVEFIQTDAKRWGGTFDICEIGHGGKLAHHLSQFLSRELRSGEHDNCQLRPEYYFAKLFIKGSTMNCFVVAHRDINKELNFPDDPQAPSKNYIKRYLDKNNIEIPKVSLCSKSLFYAPSIRDKGIEINHCINPEYLGSPKIINSAESKSEYHRDNIKNFPAQKKFFDNWLKEKATDHKQLEKKLKAKSHQILNLNQILLIED